jgi:hypothetical protein
MDHADARAGIVQTLHDMPEELFGYVVLACQQLVKDYGNNGGFTPASRRSLADLGRGVTAYLTPDADLHDG